MEMRLKNLYEQKAEAEFMLSGLKAGAFVGKVKHLLVQGQLTPTVVLVGYFSDWSEGTRDVEVTAPLTSILYFTEVKG